MKYILEDKIEHVLKQIEKYVPDATSIFQFGSSIYLENKSFGDIDILVLCKNTLIYWDYEAQLKKMKAALLKGLSHCGIEPIQSPMLQNISIGISEDRRFELTSVPVFTFGPMKPIGLEATNPLIFHFKGPITLAHYRLFCEQFPFHSNALLYNNRRLRGENNLCDFVKEVNIEKYDMQIWNQALQHRVKKSSDVFGVFKCLRKLVQQYLIYKRCFKSEEGYMKDNLFKLLNFEIPDPRVSPISLDDIKMAFSELFKKIEKAEIYSG